VGEFFRLKNALGNSVEFMGKRNTFSPQFGQFTVRHKKEGFNV